MSTNNLLFATVQTLRDKLQAAATGATPEELAYLASALEKIAGQASLLDLAEALSQAIAQIQGAAQPGITQAQQEAHTLRQNILAAIEAKRLTAEQSLTAATQSANASVATRIAQMQAVAEALRDTPLPSPGYQLFFAHFAR